MNLQSSTLKEDESGEPFHVQQARQIRLFRKAWADAGHAREGLRQVHPPLGVTHFVALDDIDGSGDVERGTLSARCRDDRGLEGGQWRLGEHRGRRQRERRNGAGKESTRRGRAPSRPGRRRPVSATPCRRPSR